MKFVKFNTNFLNCNTIIFVNRSIKHKIFNSLPENLETKRWFNPSISTPSLPPPSSLPPLQKNVFQQHVSRIISAHLFARNRDSCSQNNAASYFLAIPHRVQQRNPLTVGGRIDAEQTASICQGCFTCPPMNFVSTLESTIFFRVYLVSRLVIERLKEKIRFLLSISIE